MTAILTATGLNKRQDTGRASFTHVAFGTGSVTPTEGMTSLIAEVVRVAATVSLSGAVITYEVFLNSNQGNGTLLEWGIWDAPVAGNLLAYGVLDTAVVKEATEAQIVALYDTAENIV